MKRINMMGMMAAVAAIGSANPSAAETIKKPSSSLWTDPNFGRVNSKSLWRRKKFKINQRKGA